MTNLLDDDCALEAGLLGVEALELDARLVVPDAVGRGWRMVADLLGDESGLAGLVLPLAKEELAEEGV